MQRKQEDTEEKDCVLLGGYNTTKDVIAYKRKRTERVKRGHYNIIHVLFSTLLADTHTYICMYDNFEMNQGYIVLCFC